MFSRCWRVTKIRINETRWDTDANKFWQQENELVNHRLSWLGTTQSFLFAGVVFSHQFDFDIGRGVAIFGMATSAVIFIGTLAAVIAQLIIALAQPKNRFGVSWITTAMGWSSAILIPLLFVFGWGYLFKSYEEGKFLQAEEKPSSVLESGQTASDI